MAVELPSGQNVASYTMVLGEHRVAMEAMLGQPIRLIFSGDIHCQNCHRRTKKSYSGGFCYPCAQKLAQCDLCFMKPETCHYDAGTCREPDWGQSVCMQDHLVYLANSSGLKVGITRINQVPTRWIDQGATQAIPIFRVNSRYQSGLLEVIFKAHVSDRTDWRKMLRGSNHPIDLLSERDYLLAQCHNEINEIQQRFGVAAISLLPSASVVTIDYPVQQYPVKITSLNFDKTAEISGILQGIKGQYLLLDCGVLNLRKFSGYDITLVTAA